MDSHKKKKCVKECSLRRRYNCFRWLFRLTCCLATVEFILATCIITSFTQFQVGMLSIDLARLPPLLDKTRFTGLKDISTTVGLTGVLFAWLLQIIGEKTCNITTDELFEWEYPHYLWQIMLFIQFTLMCIYTCGSSGPGRLLALVTFAGMLCGIFNMWLMCATFLFNMGDRRQVAFCILRKRLEKQWDQTALHAWAQELNTCIDRNEKTHINTLLTLICQKAQQIKKKEQSENKIWLCAKFCGETMSILWNEVGADRWHSYLCDMLNQLGQSDATHTIMAAYLIQAAKLRKETDNADRYMAVLECLGRGIESLSKVPAYVLETYIAFLVIYQEVTNTPAPDFVYTFLSKIKLEQPMTSDQECRKQIIMITLQSYAVNYTYNYNNFACMHWTPELLRRFDMYMDQF